MGEAMPRPYFLCRLTLEDMSKELQSWGLNLPCSAKLHPQFFLILFIYLGIGD